MNYDMSEEEAVDFMKKFEPTGEAYDFSHLCIEHPQARRELLEFIDNNNLDCTHSEDNVNTPECHAAIDHWHMFAEKVLELMDKYIPPYDPDEDEEEEE